MFLLRLIVRSVGVDGKLLGAHPSTAGLATQISERAAGNPFFAEEIVRDLVEREILEGRRGAYVCRGEPSTSMCPRRSRPPSPHASTALASVPSGTLKPRRPSGRGSTRSLLRRARRSGAGGFGRCRTIVAVDLRPEYAFRHPLIRAVAYESQLKSERAQLHRKLAAAIERRGPRRRTRTPRSSRRIWGQRAIIVERSAGTCARRDG